MTKLVATECRCGSEIHHPADDDPPGCTLCGEPCCSACDYWVSPGLYGHRKCVTEDGIERAAMRMRITRLLATMPLGRLKRVLSLVEYLSHKEVQADRAQMIARERGEKARLAANVIPMRRP